MPDARGRQHGVDARFVAAWWRRSWLPVWFFVISAIRLTGVVGAGPGVDARLYIDATRAYLAGGDPWLVNFHGLYFAAPPPTLLTTVPFALLPGELGVAALLLTGLLGSIAALRWLRLPLWWLAFPPLADALWMGNPQTLLLPLLVAPWPLVRAIAPMVKVYAVIPLLGRPDRRALLYAGAFVLVSVPLLPWGLFLGELRPVLERLSLQAGPGMSAWAIPALVPIAALGLLALPRERSRWLAVPVLWPSTQWYYASLALPGCTPLAAAVLAIQVPGLFAIVPLVALAELHWRRVGAWAAARRPRWAQRAWR